MTKLSKTKDQIESQGGWIPNALSGAKAALFIFVGMFVFKIGYALFTGEFQLSLEFALQTVSSILQDMILGYLGDVIFPIIGMSVVVLVGYICYMLIYSAPLWPFFIRFVTFLATVFALSYAASFLDGSLPEWAMVIIGLFLWGVFFLVAGLLGFVGYASTLGRDRYLY